MKLLNIGFGNMVNADRIIGIVSPDSAPIKRLVQDAREKGALIDASYGRRTQAVLIMDSDHVILSGIPLESLTGRANSFFNTFNSFFLLRYKFIFTLPTDIACLLAIAATESKNQYLLTKMSLSPAFIFPRKSLMISSSSFSAS